MIDTPLGRRKSLAASSAATAVACLGFCLVHSQALVTFITVIISLAATVRCIFLKAEGLELTFVLVDNVGNPLRVG